MPSPDLISLSLFKATPAQVIESLRRARSHWGKDFTEEEYANRDESWIKKLECAKDGKFTTWVLAPRDDPETLNFKCSCKTFKRPGITAKNIENADIQPKNVFIYAIGSVFTPSVHRGCGYAGHMMRLLHWVLAPDSYLEQFVFPTDLWGEPPQRYPGAGDGAVSVLYSDIGPTFYATCAVLLKGGSGPVDYNESDDIRAGWIVRDPSSVIWNTPATVSEPDALLSEDETWNWLDEQEVDNLWDHDASLMSSDLISTISSPTTPESVAFAMLPNGGIEPFNRRRYIHILQDYDITQWGALVHNSSNPTVPRSFVTWTVEIPRKGVQYDPEFAKKLILTRLRVENTDHFRVLLLRAFEVARKHDIPTVEVWDLAEELKGAARDLGGNEFLRENKLSAFKWYGQEMSRDVKWMFNERYCWY